MANNRSSDGASRKVRPAYDQTSMGKGLKISSGIYLGIVVDAEDSRKQGRVKVQIIKFYGTIPLGVDVGAFPDPELYQGAMWCRTMIPMGGVTSPAEGQGGIGQNVYGIMGQPPSLHNEVVVAFSSDTHTGIILGVLPDPGKISGGAAAGVSGLDENGEVTPLTEKSKTDTDPNTPPPAHPQGEAIKTQGLHDDNIRGQTSSSPTRDPSSRVMGITTPAGHSLAMDDGRLEDGDSLLVRLRTAGGAQILMDDTNGLTYIINRNGSAWIELNSSGDIDIYSANSINMATQGDFNINCGGSFNVNATRSVIMQSNGAVGIQLAAPSGSVDVFAHANLNLQSDGNGNLRVAGNYRETAGRIDMNGPPALAATQPSINQLAENTNVTESVATRVPEAEPWGGHLDISTITGGSGGSGGGGATGGAGAPDISNYPDAGTGENLEWAPGKNQAVDPALIALVEEVCRRFGRNGIIISGFRNPSYNASVSGAKKSQHMLGQAIDVVFGGGALTSKEKNTVISIASAVGIKGIGIYSNSFHFDNRDGARQGWGSDFTRNSVPGYAVDVMNTHRANGFASAFA